MSRSAAVQNRVRSKHSRRVVPISRSTNGCESGTYRSVLISFTSSIRKFACHWWNRYSGSWSELRYVGGVWHCVARLNIRHSPAPSTTPRCTPKPTMRRVHWSITNEHPVGAQDRRLASKQIETPQTVLGVTEDREPGRPSRPWCRLVPNGENAPHHVLVHGNRESQDDLLSDPGTTPGRIPPFHGDDGCDHIPVGPLGARLLPHIGE